MEVLHVIEGFTAAHGGLASCVADLLEYLHRADSGISLLTPLPKSENDIFLGHNCNWVHTFANDLVLPIGYSRNAKKFLEEKDVDLYHINGLWQYIDHKASTLARKRGKPYIITPHGMLYPEALNRSKLKKLPIKNLWINPDVASASCFHATCEAEMYHIRDFGYTGPIAVIANPLNIPSFSEELFNRRFQQGDLQRCDLPKKIGFLGRLHPIKKVENLLYGAVRAIVDTEIHIMGSGSMEYESFLIEEMERLGLTEKVKFHGFVSGKEKFEALASLDCLFVPSDMENFGMIVPETLMVGTPVMASLGTPWESLNTNKCGWWVDNSPESIAKVIDRLSELSESEIKAMGNRGRAMVIREFEASRIAGKMIELYNWILNRGDKPDFVYES